MFGITRKTVASTLKAIHGFLSEETSKPQTEQPLSRLFYAVYVRALTNLGIEPLRPPQPPQGPPGGRD